MLNGRPAFAVVPWGEYEKLIRFRDNAGSDIWFPQSVVEANAVREESLIKAWREYFGLTQKELAKRAGIQPRSLFEKMRTLGLRKEDYRPRRRKSKDS